MTRARATLRGGGPAQGARVWAALALATAACGSDSSLPTAATPAPSLLEPVRSGVTASPDGRWLVGSAGRWGRLLVVEGDAFSLQPIAEGTAREGHFRTISREGEHLVIGTPDEQFGQLHIFFRDADHAVGLLPGESGLAEAVRVASVPNELLGEWEIAFSDNYHLSGGHVTLEEARWRIRVGDRVAREGRAFRTEAESGSWRLALTEGDAAARTYQLLTVSSGVLLVWPEGSDEYQLWRRAEAGASWLPAEGTTIPNPFLDGSGE